MAVRWKTELKKQGGYALIANGIVWMICPFGGRRTGLVPATYLSGPRYPFAFYRNENYRHTLGIVRLNAAAEARRAYVAERGHRDADYRRPIRLASAYLAIADSVRMRLDLPLADDGKQGIKTDLVRDRIFLRHTFGLDPYFQQAAE
jgi:hypothetical protein